MGVDFDKCDMCYDITCGANINYIDIFEFGTCKVCNICIKEYFYKDDPCDNVDICQEALDGAEYTFYCGKDGAENWEDVIYETQDPFEVKSWTYDGDDGDNNRFVWGWSSKNKYKTEDPYFYWVDEDDLVLLEAASSYREDVQELDGTDIFYDYQSDMLPTDKWKEVMKLKLDGQITHLQNKRKTLNDL
jgi:hypothetical protein